MSEVFAWPEGALYIWSGSANASGASVAYVNNASIAMQYQWGNEALLDGSYRNHLQGKRGNINVTFAYTMNDAIVTLAEATATVHFKLQHDGVNGSAGFIAYSGKIDSLNVQGSENGTYAVSMAAHCNLWSAY